MRPAVKFLRTLTGRLAMAAAAALCLAARPSLAVETLEPATSLPGVQSVSGDDYYILLLKWSRNVVMKPLTARVVYLDPPLYLAWLKQTDPGVTQEQFANALTGFPQALRFRIDYQAASRNLLQAPSWKVELIEANGRRVAAESGHRVEAATLESNSNGIYWQEKWEYKFDVPADLLNAKTGSFGIALEGPSGSGTARWRFGAVTVVAAHPDAYVPYLGTALLALSALVVVGLVLTRRSRGGLS